MKRTVDEWRISAKFKAAPALEPGNPWRQPPFLPPCSDKNERQKHFKSRRKSQASKPKNFEKRQMNENRISPVSSDRDSNTPLSLSLERKQLLYDLPG